MPETQSGLDELRARVARLESATRPRGSINLVGAARYLGISEETLRREHKMGRGPNRKRRGSRGWSYSYADLDAYRNQADSE
jgi:hypothetical protein